MMQRVISGARTGNPGSRARILAIATAVVLLAMPLAAQEKPRTLSEADAETGQAAVAVGADRYADQTNAGASGARPAIVASGLVPIGLAAASIGPVQVAGTVDRSTISDRQVNGLAGYGFEIFDAAGGRLPVVVPGDRPVGFDRAETVVVTGSFEEERLLASEVLIPGAAQWPSPNRGLTGVMAISLIVWLGLFAYMFRVDRKVHRMEVS